MLLEMLAICFLLQGLFLGVHTQPDIKKTWSCEEVWLLSNEQRSHKNLCVEDTRLGPTDAVPFGGLGKPVSRISGIFEFCSATLLYVVVFYF